MNENTAATTNWTCEDAEDLVRILQGFDPGMTVQEVLTEAYKWQVGYWQHEAVVQMDTASLVACDMVEVAGMTRKDTGYGDRVVELIRHAQARAEGTVPLEVRAATA